jgi:hypothetical protein
MALNDVYEVTVHQTMRGQKLANVFHYHQRATVVVASGNTAMAVATEFWDTIGQQWLTCVTNDVRVDRIHCRNLFLASEEADYAVDLVGANGGAGAQDTMPSFVAIAYKLSHDQGGLLKSGAKRIAGVADAVVTDGVLTNVDYANGLTVLGTLFYEPLQWGTVIRDNVWFPIIVKRVKEMEGGIAKYRLPASLAELAFGTVVSAVFGLEVGTQVSRRVKVG